MKKGLSRRTFYGRERTESDSTLYDTSDDDFRVNNSFEVPETSYSDVSVSLELSSTPSRLEENSSICNDSTQELPANAHQGAVNHSSEADNSPDACISHMEVDTATKNTNDDSQNKPSSCDVKETQAGPSSSKPLTVDASYNADKTESIPTVLTNLDSATSGVKSSVQIQPSSSKVNGKSKSKETGPTSGSNIRSSKLVVTSSKRKKSSSTAAKGEGRTRQKEASSKGNIKKKKKNVPPKTTMDNHFDDDDEVPLLTLRLNSCKEGSTTVDNATEELTVNARQGAANHFSKADNNKGSGDSDIKVDTATANTNEDPNVCNSQKKLSSCDVPTETALHATTEVILKPNILNPDSSKILPLPVPPLDDAINTANVDSNVNNSKNKLSPCSVQKAHAEAASHASTEVILKPNILNPDSSKILPLPVPPLDDAINTANVDSNVNNSKNKLSPCSVQKAHAEAASHASTEVILKPNILNPDSTVILPLLVPQLDHPINIASDDSNVNDSQNKPSSCYAKETQAEAGPSSSKPLTLDASNNADKTESIPAVLATLDSATSVVKSSVQIQPSSSKVNGKSKSKKTGPSGLSKLSSMPILEVAHKSKKSNSTSSHKNPLASIGNAITNSVKRIGLSIPKRTGNRKENQPPVPPKKLKKDAVCTPPSKPDQQTRISFEQTQGPSRGEQSETPSRCRAAKRKKINYQEDNEEDIDDPIWINDNHDLSECSSVEDSDEFEAHDDASSSDSDENHPVSERSDEAEPPTEDYVWTEADIIETIIRDYELQYNLVDEMKEPFQYFLHYFSDDLLADIVQKSNRYCQNKGRKYELNLTVPELKIFLAIQIYMGVIKAPAYRDYWASESRVPQIAGLMPLRRFQQIKANINYYDPEEKITEDREIKDPLKKIRSVYDHIRTKCNQLPQCCTRFSIDEAMVPTKTKKAGPLRQYVKGKPHPWGFKLFVITGEDGTAYNFFIYVGKDTFKLENITEHKVLGIGGNAVTHLCKVVKEPQGSAVCFDNYFTSLPLLSFLQSNFGMYAIGTIRGNRTKGCPLPSDKVMKKKGRGFCSSWKNEDDVVVVKWMDKKVVTLAGSWAGIEPKTQVQRWDKKSRQEINVECPRLVKLYNTYMGGVDLMDMLIQLYRLPSRSKRWTNTLFAWLVDLTLVNSFLEYRRGREEMMEPKQSSKKFRLSVVAGLVLAARPRQRSRGRPALNDIRTVHPDAITRSPVSKRPRDEMRYDGLNHYPVFVHRGRCKNCSIGFSFLECSKCKVRLCLMPTRNCFTQFHIPSSEEQDEQEVPET